MTLEQTCMMDPNPYLAAQVEMQVLNANAPINNRRRRQRHRLTNTNSTADANETTTASSHLYANPRQGFGCRVVTNYRWVVVRCDGGRGYDGGFRVGAQIQQEADGSLLPGGVSFHSVPSM